MALGTFFSGDVKCAWCGSYIKNTDGGLGDALGLDIVKRAGPPRYRIIVVTRARLPRNRQKTEAASTVTAEAVQQ